MMRLLWQAEGGFTLIELALVIALSSMMLVMLLGANTSTNSQNTFTAATDQLLGTIKSVQNQSTSVTSDRSGVSTGNSPYVVFGKGIIFQPNSTQYTVTTFIQPQDATDGDEMIECDDTAQDLPDGMKDADATPAAIVFRSVPNQIYYASGYTTVLDAGGVCENPGVQVGLGSGKVKAKLVKLALKPAQAGLSSLGSFFSSPAQAAGSDLLAIDAYTLNGPFAATGTVNFSDPGDTTQQATITVNPIANTVTRSFLH